MATAKSSNSKKSKYDDKDRKYYRLSVNNIKNWADQLGTGELTDDVAMLLSEDTSYRIRQMIEVASHVMLQSKRSRLTTDDIIKAAKLCRLEPVYGLNGSEGGNQFKTIPYKESKLHYLDDREVNVRSICMDEELPGDPGQVSVRAHWLSISGSSAAQHSIISQQLNQANITYFKGVVQGLKSQDPRLVRVIMNDLRANKHIAIILPYVLYYLISSIKSRTNVFHSLQGIQSLIENNCQFLLPYLVQLISSLMTCTLDEHHTADAWKLRNKSAMLVAMLVRKYKSFSPHIYPNMANKLREVLASSDKPRYSHYGALMILAYLGGQELYLTLRAYLSRNWFIMNQMLQSSDIENSVKLDILQIQSALLNVASVVVRDLENHVCCEGHLKASSIYSELYAYYGDSIGPAVSQFLSKSIIQQTKQKFIGTICRKKRQRFDANLLFAL